MAGFAFGFFAFVAWYVIVALVFDRLSASPGFYDRTLGTHMGSDAVAFPYGLGLVAAYGAPLVVLSLLMANRGGFLLHPLALSVAMVAWSTLWFDASGAVTCQTRLHPARDLMFTIAILLTPILVPFVFGLTLGRTDHRWGALSLGLVAAATSGLLDYAQWSHCASFSKQVVREIDGVTLILLALPFAVGAAALGRRLR